MGDTKTFPVKRRIRRSGLVYAPNTDRAEIELGAKEAKRLGALGCIANPAEDDEADFDLDAALKELGNNGHDVASLNMADIGKLLGRNGRGVKRADVDASLERLTNTAGSSAA